MAALYECLYVCCISLYMYMCVQSQTNVCVSLYSAKGINDVALNKKYIPLPFFYVATIN